jgi:hypothetical protein
MILFQVDVLMAACGYSCSPQCVEYARDEKKTIALSDPLIKMQTLEDEAIALQKVLL